VQIIEERFASIETSVEFLEKEIDGIEIPNVSDIQSQLAALEVQMQDFKEDINELKKEIKELESNKNPLLN
jgi:chromosome segregation ATPase